MPRTRAPGVVLRAATFADANAIAELHLRSWRATYDPLFDAADRARITLAERRAAWRRQLASDPDGVWLAEGDGGLLGFVSLGRQADPDLDPGLVAEVVNLHVRPGSQRHGLGRRLLRLAERRLRAAGYGEAVLWVLAENAPARAFYERVGWRPDGATIRHEMGGVPGLPAVDEVRYRRSL